MGKESGLAQACYIAGRDVSGDTKQFAIQGGPALLSATNIRQSANARVGGLISAGFSYTTHFDPAGASYLLSSPLPTVDEVITMAHRETLGAPAMSMVAKQINYAPTRSDDGDLLFAVEAQSNQCGADWGVLATPGMRIDTAATNGASIDHGAAGAFGLQAYLHVFAFTGTSATIKLQGSSDDGAGDAFADITGGSFGAQSAIGAAKISTARAQAVERYLRVVTTGVFTSVTFAVAVVINDVQVLV